MTATSSTGRPNVTSMPMIAITASVVFIQLSEGQRGQHYRGSMAGRTMPPGWDDPWTRRRQAPDSSPETRRSGGDLLRHALRDHRLLGRGQPADGHEGR